MASKPPAKRARTDGDDNFSEKHFLDPITPNVLERSEDLAAAYRNAKPYPHGMIHDFCKEGFLGEHECVLSFNIFFLLKFAIDEYAQTKTHFDIIFMDVVYIMNKHRGHIDRVET